MPARLLALVLAAGLAPGAALAADPPPPSTAVNAAPDAATIAAQGTTAGIPPCASCHGAQGYGNAESGFPRLAGLPAAYIHEQLGALAAGTRDSPLMGPIAKMLTPAEMQAMAAYYAGLPPPDIHPAPPSGAGAALALDGRTADRLPACEACHGPGGIGVGASFPPLAGQPASYIQAQLEAWQQGKRPPGPLGLMPAVAKRLSPADVAAAAAFFGVAAQADSK